MFFSGLRYTQNVNLTLFTRKLQSPLSTMLSPTLRLQGVLSDNVGNPGFVFYTDLKIGETPCIYGLTLHFHTYT